MATPLNKESMVFIGAGLLANAKGDKKVAKELYRTANIAQILTQDLTPEALYANATGRHGLAKQILATDMLRRKLLAKATKSGS